MTVLPNHPEQDQPLVTVLMMTYNHAAFLEQAVKSVMQQVCGFRYELLIGDDCSTDATLEIANKLRARYPDVIRLLPTDENLGITPNFQRLVDASRGKYIAMLEGDDYWVENRKLQLQFDLMESDDALSLCAGRTQNRQFWSDPKPRYTLDDLLRRYIFHTSTLFFRRNDVPSFAGYEDIHALDTLLIAFLAEKGDCGYIDKELSYYRRHEGGAWTGREQAAQLKAMWSITTVLSNHFNSHFDKALCDRELWFYGMMIRFNLAVPLFSQWKNHLELIKLIVNRNFPVLPMKSSALVITILLQPVTALLDSLRFKLGLKSRLFGRSQ